MVFFKFLNFFAIFLEFSITDLVGTHQNDFFFLLSRPFPTYIGLKSCQLIFSYSAFPNLFSLFLGLPQHILPRKEAIIVFSIFLEFSTTGRVGTPRNDFFYFLSFSAFPNLLSFEKLPECWFLIFWIFLLFFGNLLLRVG